MNVSTLRANDVLCLNENDQYTLIFLDGEAEIARIAVTAATAEKARAAIDRAMMLELKLASLKGVDVTAKTIDLDLPPLVLHEAKVVVGSALRRIAPEDTVVGFELFPRGNGIFDWSLEDAGPLGALYDSTVRQVLGVQAGEPRGIPMAPPIIELEHPSA